MPSPFAAYVLCGTPRSGSTLLCEMLSAFGVAGRPNSYFRAEDIGWWADAWGVPHPEGVEAPGFDCAYLAALRHEAGAGTGLVGLRLMWASVPEATRRLGRALGGARDLAASLEAAFGPVLFVHVSRRDHVAQAVSRLRAEQSGLWHLRADGSVLEAEASLGPVAYDGARLAALVEELKGDEAGWAAFFASRGIDPLHLVYEDVAADPPAALARLLEALGRDATSARAMAVPTARMADEQNRHWIEQFRQESSNGA